MQSLYKGGRDARGPSEGFDEVQPTDLAALAIAEALQLVRSCFGGLNSGREERTRVDPLVTLRDEQQGRTHFWAK